MANIFLVEDDDLTLKTLTRYYTELGNKVYSFKHGIRALNSFKKLKEILDIAILDIYLPGINGLEILHIIRQQEIKTPVLVLTIDSNVETLVRAFDIGADDFLRKPFSIDELDARIKSLMKNYNVRKEEILKLGDIVIRVDQRRVFLSDKEVYLGRKEFDLLLFLARNKNKVFSRDEIIASVWPFDQDPYQNTIDVHVCMLRKKLKAKDLIETVFGVGYRLNHS